MGVDEPDLPALERVELPLDGELVLDGAEVEGPSSEPLQVRQISVVESRVRAVALARGRAPGLLLRDAILRDCDFSNVQGSEGVLRRVEIRDSRFIGFVLHGGTVNDLRVADSTFALASFAGSELRNVAFEGVDLGEASFRDARLEAVEFVGCQLAGADFSGARVRASAIRGSTLDGVVGIESLRGLTMPWPDIVASAGALADALGIRVESD